jgi:hypothetical protein
MAEYYPLLAKAVAGLPEPTREARQALYERARNALLNQLRNLQPPVAEADILRETEALAAAAARVEAEYDAPSAGAAVIPPAPAAQPQRPIGDPPKSAPAAARPQQPFAQPLRRPPVAPDVRASSAPPQNSDRIDDPAVSVPAGAAALAGGTAPGPDAAPLRGPSPPKAPSTPGAAKPEAAPRAEASASAPPLKFRPEMSRPYAPQPQAGVETQPHMRRLWLVVAIVALFVVLIAVVAWKLRDRPEDLMRLKPAAQTQAETSGKIVERVGGGAKPQDAARAPAASPSATTRANTEDTAPVPVTQRAALLVEAPEEQSKVKTYVGTVVWRLENVSNGSDQPVSTAVRADIELPEAKLKVSMIFQKNFDATLSASHTVKLVFSPSADSPVGTIKEIRVPQMRGADAQNGDSLGGIPVPIMANYFLVGLSRGGSEAVNLDLIKQREWVDVPLVLQTNNRIGKLTFEKGTAGARAIDDAIAAWQGQ